MRIAVFTVCSNDRVPQATLLLRTVARFLPAARRVLVLADEPHPCVAYPIGCELIPASALGVPDFPQFAFRYDPVEFAAALKPFAFRFLLEHRACTHCLYADPGCELFSDLPAVTDALEANAAFVLTPRLLVPDETDPKAGAEAGAGPPEADMMRKGAFDGGLLGVSATAEARDLLGWWARWLRRHCVDDWPAGLYLDQRFLDLIPGLASGVRILHDPGLCVAADTLSRRRFVPDAPGGPTVDGAPLGLFRYGAVGSDDGDSLPPAWRGFLAAYATRLRAAGHGSIPASGYAYGRFASGVPIPAIARRMFRDDHAAWAGNPFDSYEGWCHLPAPEAVAGMGSAVPSLMMLWLQARLPALAGLSLRNRDGAEALTRWWIGHGASGGVDERFVQPQAIAAGSRALCRRAIRPAPSPDRPDVTVVAPFAADGAASLVGRALADGLISAGARVERLDVLAMSARPAGGRVIAFCMAPEQLRPFLHVLSPRLPSRAYRVFVPAAESVELSPAFAQALAEFDEVWTPTRFVQARLVLATDLPVLHMPLRLAAARLPGPPDTAASVGQMRPGLPYVLATPDAFGDGALLGAIEAFQAAFGAVPSACRPRLVVAGSAPATRDAAWQRAIAGTEATEMPWSAGLLARAACVLALHGGEALGLSTLRALACGVPTIATEAGGCTDVFSPRTGFPVDVMPGGAGPARAAADTRHAAWRLREVFARPDEARRRAALGRRAVAASGDPARLASRLAVLGLLPAAHALDTAA